MPVSPGTGGVSGGGIGTGFQLFTQTADNQSAIYTGVDQTAAEAARDAYFGSNPDDLATLDANEFLIIKLIVTGTTPDTISYQQRQSNEWVDVTSLVQGESGATTTNLQAGTVAVSDGNEFTSQGINVDQSDGEVTFDASINVPSASIKVGEAMELSEGISDLVIVDLLDNTMSFSTNSDFDDSTGSSVPAFFDFAGPVTTNINLVDTTIITTNPLLFDITGTSTPPDVTLVDQAIIRSNGPMTNFRAKITDNATGIALRYIPSKAAFDGTLTGLSIIAGDTTFFFASNAVDTATTFHLGFVPFIIESGQQVDFEVVADSIDVLGNGSNFPYLVLETHDGPPIDVAPVAQAGFTATSIPFVDSDLRLAEDTANLSWDDGTNTLNVENLTVDGTLTTVDVQTLSVVAAFVDTNAGYTTTTPREGGLLTNYLPTGTTATVTAGAFVAGIASTSNPTVATVEASSLAADDIIQISASTANDGIYEVLTHAANVLTIRGVGVTPTNSTFALNQFTADASDNATITKINVGVSQFSATGDLQTGKGAEVASVTYENLVRNEDSTVNLQIPAASGIITLNFRDEVPTTQASISFDDSGPRFDITASESMNITTTSASNDLSIDAMNASLILNSGAISPVQITAGTSLELASVSGNVSLNARTFVSSDGETLSMQATAASTVGIDLLSSGAAQKLELFYDDNTDTTRIRSAVDLTISATTGAVNLSTDAAGQDVNIDSSGGMQFFASDDCNIEADTLDLTLQANTTNINLDSAGLVLVNTQTRFSADGQFLEIRAPALQTVAFELADSVGNGEWEVSYNDTTTNVVMNADPAFSILGQSTILLRSDAALDIATLTSGDITLTSVDDIVLLPTGNVGIGLAAPTSFFHVFQNTSGTGDATGAKIEQDGGGDAILHFDLSATQDWTIGVDNSNSDAFSLFAATSLGTGGGVGNWIMLPTGEFGLNKTPRANHCLDIDTLVNTVVALYDTKDVTLEQGNSPNTNSTDFFFNRADAGFNQSEFHIFNENDVTIEMRHFQLNYTDAGTTGGLSVRHSGFVAVGVGSNEEPLTTLTVRSDGADTTAIETIETTGTNAGTTHKFVGDRDPNGVITGAGSDEYTRDDGATSGSYESLEATTGTEWFKRSINPISVIEINTSEQYEELATAGTINITTTTALIIKTGITSSTDFDVSGGADLLISSPNRSSIVYTGTGTLFTAVDSTVRLTEITIIAVAGGTFVSAQGTALNVVELVNVTLIGWILGSIDRSTSSGDGTAFVAIDVFILNWDDTLTLSNLASITISRCSIVQLDDVSVNLPVFEFISDRPNGYELLNCVGRLSSGETLVRVDPAISISRILVSDCTIDTGDGLFDESGTTGTYTAVADNSIASTAISSVTDNGGIAVFNHAGTDPFLGSTVTLSGYVTNTAYNVTGIVSVSSAGSFEVQVGGVNVAFGTDEASGSFVMVGITVTSTAHGNANGTSLQLSGDLSVSYDDGYTIYNVAANTFDVAATFVATETGTWSTQGLNQKNKAVLAQNNPSIIDSKYIATSFVNGNATANGAIVNNTFTDMVFGTVGTALVEASTAERWKLIDELNGTFEYTGNEPFDGYITFDFTVVSSGGTVEFRFKWEHDVGAGFVDLPDNVEALAAVGADAQSITKTFPLAATKGDQIKPQITRNSGTSGITTSYATIYATQ